MIMMQLREVTSCAVHGRAIIMLEDVHERLRLTFYADGREARPQALAQEVQQLRKALQEYCALQRRLAASAQGGWAGRALKRKLSKLTYEVSKLKDLLAEREEIMWEQDRQLRELRGTLLCPVPGVSQGRRILEELARVRKDAG